MGNIGNLGLYAKFISLTCFARSGHKFGVKVPSATSPAGGNFNHTDFPIYSLSALKLFISPCEQSLLVQRMVGRASWRRG